MVLLMKIEVKIHFYYLDTKSNFLFSIQLFYTCRCFLGFVSQLKPDALTVGSKSVNYPFRYIVGRKRDNSY